MVNFFHFDLFRISTEHEISKVSTRTPGELNEPYTASLLHQTAIEDLWQSSY